MKIIAFLLTLTSLFQLNAFAQSADKNKVMEFFQNQQFEEAIQYLSTAMVTDSQNVQLLGYLGYACHMNDNTTLSDKYYRQLLGLDATNVPALQYLAMLNKNDLPDDALQFTRRLIYLQPAKASHYRNMGELFKQINKQDSAFIYFNQAYLLAPGDYKNGVGLADALIDQKNFLRADSIIEAGLKQDSVNIPFLKLRIGSAYKADDYKSIPLPGEILMRLNETPLTALTQVVLAYYNLKLYTDCIRVCEYMAVHGYLVQNILFYQAKALAKLKQFDKSNELLTACIKLAISKDAEMYYYNKGLNYLATGAFKKAIAQYDTANYLFKNPVMNYNSGRIYEVNLKNMQQAKLYYLKCLASANPVEEDEKKAYAWLKEKWGKNKPHSSKK